MLNGETVEICASLGLDRALFAKGWLGCLSLAVLSTIMLSSIDIHSNIEAAVAAAITKIGVNCNCQNVWKSKFMKL